MKSILFVVFFSFALITQCSDAKATHRFSLTHYSNIQQKETKKQTLSKEYQNKYGVIPQFPITYLKCNDKKGSC